MCEVHPQYEYNKCVKYTCSMSTTKWRFYTFFDLCSCKPYEALNILYINMDRNQTFSDLSGISFLKKNSVQSLKSYKTSKYKQRNVEM